MAVVDEPRLLEVVRTDGAVSLARVLEAVIPRAFAKAEASQASDGGGNPRFGPIFDEPAPAEVAVGARAVLRRRHRPPRIGGVAHRRARGPVRSPATASRSRHGFGDAADALRSVVEAAGPIDAIVVAPAGRQPTATPADGWERVLAEHRGIVEHIHTDAGWARAAADYAAGAARPVRLVTLTDATTSGGRSRAQASAQLAAGRRRARPKGGSRPSRRASRPPEEAAGQPAGELVAHLLGRPRGSGPRRCGAGGRRRLARPSQPPPTRSAASPTAVPPFPIGSTPRSGRSSASTGDRDPVEA